MQRNENKIEKDVKSLGEYCVKKGVPGFIGVALDKGALTTGFGNVPEIMMLLAVLYLKLQKQTGIDAANIAEEVLAIVKRLQSEGKGKPENWTDYNPKWKKAEGLAGKKG